MKIARSADARCCLREVRQHMSGESKEEIVEMLRGIAAELGVSTVPRNEFLRRTGMSERKVSKLFGSYNALVEAAGLEARHFPTADVRLYSDAELLDEVARAIRLPNSRLTRVFFEQHSSVSASVCERRFGGWINTLRSVLSLLKADSDGSLIEKVEEYTSPGRPSGTCNRAARVTNEGTDNSELVCGSEHQGHALLSSESPNLYGDFINFRGLQHAPVNEQGVVFLFGMICRELGYVVEIVKTGFPDCEAKRKVAEKPGRWQRVRIEFEFRSRNFRSHGHDPDQCDVIVCWEDNWPECPIEVLELRSALRTISPDVSPQQ